MKSSFIHISDVIRKAAETKAALIQFKAAEKMGFISHNLSIITIAGITIFLLVINNIGTH